MGGGVDWFRRNEIPEIEEYPNRHEASYPTSCLECQCIGMHEDCLIIESEPCRCGSFQTKPQSRQTSDPTPIKNEGGPSWNHVRQHSSVGGPFWRQPISDPGQKWPMLGTKMTKSQSQRGLEPAHVVYCGRNLHTLKLRPQKP